MNRKMNNNSKLNLLSSWKIILGIITYIIVGELLKETLLFHGIEPLLINIFGDEIAEVWSEITEYILLAALLIPISLLFVVRPVNRTNKNLSVLASKYFDLANRYYEKSNRLEQEILERQKIEKELRFERNKAQQATLAKSQFLAMMSHEIRTPMNGVLGTSQLLAETNLNVEQENYVDVLLKSGQHLLYIINDILDYSKLEANQLTLVKDTYSPEKAIREVIDVMQGIAKEKNLELSFTVDNSVPKFVLGDAVRIKQIISNLLSNAIKFTYQGRVSISITTQSNSSNRLDLCFLVKDTGIGIAEDKKSALFQEFFQIDATIARSTGGTGLGLSICRKLVHLMGGEIYVKSQEGVGSEFYFTVPLIEATIKTVVLPEGERTKPEREITPIRILVVEDNPVNQLVATRMLGKLGHTFDVANNGQEALEKLEVQKYDAILMDIHMPVMDGLTAMKQIKQKFPENNRPAVIALTADALSEEKEAYLNAGMDDYIAKPFDRSTLKSMLEKYSVIEHLP